MLEQVGMRVTIAENGRRAIEILTAGEAVFDAVLMDLQMPAVDGLTAARAIMSDAAFRDLPIVAITANAFEADRCPSQIGRAHFCPPVTNAHVLCRLPLDNNKTTKTNCQQTRQ